MSFEFLLQVKMGQRLGVVLDDSPAGTSCRLDEELKQAIKIHRDKKLRTFLQIEKMVTEKERLQTYGTLLKPSDINPHHARYDERIIIVNRILKEGYTLPQLPKNRDDSDKAHQQAHSHLGNVKRNSSNDNNIHDNLPDATVPSSVANETSNDATVNSDRPNLTTLIRA